MESSDLLTSYARETLKLPNQPDDDIEVEIEELDPNTQWEEDEDGNVITVSDGEEETEEEERRFDENLARFISPSNRITLGTKILEDIARDKQAREPHDKRYAEGIRRTGLGEEAPGGAPFDGASSVTHPILVECTVDFSASTMKEIYPPSGPVKTKIIGKVTPAKRAKAERKRDHMNWQLTEQVEEYRTELEQTTMQMPLSGAGYLHFFFDQQLNRPSCEFIPSDHVWVPYGANNFYLAQRQTFYREYSQEDVEIKVESKEWVDFNSIAPSSFPERTQARDESQRVEGAEETGQNDDGLRVVYMHFGNYRINEDTETEGDLAPYVLHIDEETGDIAAIYRNWEETDTLRRKLDHVVEFKFMPWKGPYGIGFTHMIGGLAASMTGALRALLDTAHINNFPALLKMKSKTGGQTLNIEATGVTEIEGTTPVDDIRKLIMPVPFNEPSQTLYALLGFLEKSAKGVVTTAEEKIADATNNGPVGTTLALIEQGSKVYANIHSRMHHSQKKALQILHRLNRIYLDDQVTIEELGDLVIKRTDYEGPMDIVPVSDPNIFSESQRYAQLQAVRQLRTQEPDLFNRRQLIKRELQQLRVENYEELLIPDVEPIKSNPVAENVQMAMGRPAMAFPDQDHLAHLKVLIDFMMDPNFGKSPLIAPVYMQLAINHMKEHIVLWYGNFMYEAMGALVGEELDKYLHMDPVAPKVDKILSLISTDAHVGMSSALQTLPDVIAQAIQIVQQYAPPPADPIVLDVQRKQAKDKMDDEIRKANLQLQNKKSDLKKEVDDKRIAVAEKEIEKDKEVSELKAATDIIKNTDDNETAMDIAIMEIEASGKTDMTNGNGLGR